LIVDLKTGILYKKWPLDNPKAVFLLVHGLGGHSDRWNFLAEFFLKQNIASYSIELKGFGETKDLKGHIDSFDIYFKDIETLQNIIRSELPGKKVFIIGESLGGLISFLLSGLNPGLFNGLICISPAFKDKLKFTLLEYIKTFTFVVFNPKKAVDVHFNDAMCTRDLEYQKIMGEDNREYRFATAKMLFNILISGMRAQGFKHKIKIPTLFLIAGEDTITDAACMNKVFASLSVSDKEIIEYPEMFHALSIDLDREKVFTDILNWVVKRT
jgi:alpha-beta hydrolase superfamily lysophospholipase